VTTLWQAKGAPDADRSVTEYLIAAGRQEDLELAAVVGNPNRAMAQGIFDPVLRGHPGEQGQRPEDVRPAAHQAGLSVLPQQLR
jgi:hypothetical protein